MSIVESERPSLPPRLPILDLDDSLLDLLPAAVYVCDAAGLIVRYNRKAAELWGRAPRCGDTEQKFCGAHRLFWPDGRLLPHDQTPMAAALQSGVSTRDQEVVIEQPNGKRVYASVNIDPLKDESGRIVGAVNCFVDITARKQAEKKAQEVQTLLQSIVETTPECIKIVARDGTLLHMNPAGLRMVECGDAAKAVGSSTFDLIAPEDRATWREHHERVCHGERLTWRFDIVGLNGTRRRMETHAAPLTMPDGTVAQLAVTRDISEQARYENELRDRERHFRELLEGLPAAIYTTDAAGRITFYNQAAADLAGRRPEIGEDDWCITWRLYNPDGTPLPHDQCPMAIALKENRPVRGVEILVERPDGSRAIVLPYPTPLRDSAGKLVGAVNVLIDITERKRAEVA
ncbi:MAG TPA: PAS domain-containing protein, partial [Alphaproteobacteria bacterium]|nr:PAS domain-containing protein [Alphaproteobacteria bacterium]